MALGAEESCAGACLVPQPRVRGAGRGGHGAARVPGQDGSCQEAKPPSLHCMEMRARPAASRSLRPPAAFPRGLRLGGGSARPTARPGSRHARLTAPGGTMGSVPRPFFCLGLSCMEPRGCFFRAELAGRAARHKTHGVSARAGRAPGCPRPPRSLHPSDLPSWSFLGIAAVDSSWMFLPHSRRRGPGPRPDCP